MDEPSRTTPREAGGPVVCSQKIMSAKEQKVLSAEADKILARAGYSVDGRLKTTKRESLRAISTPCGGKPSYHK